MSDFMKQIMAGIDLGSTESFISENKELIGLDESGSATLNLDDLLVDGEGNLHLAIRQDNMARLVKEGFLNAQVGDQKVSTLEEGVQKYGELLMESATGYVEVPHDQFAYNLSDEDADHLAGTTKQADGTHKKNEWTRDDKGNVLINQGGKQRKLSAKVPFKLSKGNIKVGGDTVIINMSSATDCMSGLAGLCELYDNGKCYALGAEKLRADVLRSKRLQGVQWRNLSGEKLGLAILVAIASLSNASKIKYIRLNEAGDFANLDTSHIEGQLKSTAKRMTDDKKKMIAKMGSDDIKKVDDILTTFKRVAHGQAEEVFKEILGSEFVSSTKTSAKAIIKGCVDVAKRIGVYTYTHRKDLNTRLMELANKHPNFCINGSTGMMSNSFRAVEWDVFAQVFKNNGARAIARHSDDNGKVLEDLPTLIKNYLNTASKNGKSANKYIKACMENCSICDFCKKPSNSLILIPIHGSGGETGKYLQVLNRHMNDIVSEIKDTTYPALGGLTLEQAVFEHKKLKNSDPKKKTLYTGILNTIHKVFETALATKEHQTTDKDGKNITINVHKDIFQKLIFGKERFEAVVDIILNQSSVDGIITNIKNTASQFALIEGALETLQHTDEKDAIVAIAQTNVFLHPHNETMQKIPKWVNDLRKKQEKVDSLLDDVSGGSGSAQFSKIVEVGLKKQIADMVKYIGKLANKSDATDEEKRALESTKHGYEQTLESINRIAEGLKDKSVQKMDLGEIQEATANLREKIESVVNKGHLSPDDLPLVKRMFKIIDNTLNTENTGTAQIYYGVLKQLNEHFITLIKKLQDGEDIDDVKLSLSSNTKAKATTSAKDPEDKPVNESWMSQFGSASMILED